MRRLPGCRPCVARALPRLPRSRPHEPDRDGDGAGSRRESPTGTSCSFRPAGTRAVARAHPGTSMFTCTSIPIRSSRGRGTTSSVPFRSVSSKRPSGPASRFRPSTGRSRSACPRECSRARSFGSPGGERRCGAVEARGDLFIVVKVVTPTVYDDRSRELLRELDRLNPLDVAPRALERRFGGLLVKKRSASGRSGPESPRSRGKGKGYYMISAVAESYGIHPQTLRLYEREGLLSPSRTEGNTRLYSDDDLKQLETILNLTRDLGVNLAGVEIILNMRGKMERMQIGDQRVRRVRAARDGEAGRRMERARLERAGEAAPAPSGEEGISGLNEPKCAECGDTAWMRVVKDGIEGVTRCGCYLDERQGSAMTKAGVPRRYEECAFDARGGGRQFDQFDRLAHAYRVAQDWADRFPDVEAGLLLSGPPGVGKTHLAVADLAAYPPRAAHRRLRAFRRFSRSPPANQELVPSRRSRDGERRAAPGPRSGTAGARRPGG